MKRTDRTLLALGAAAFVAVYYAARWRWGITWLPELLYLVPPLVATTLFARRALGERGREAWFWGMLALGPATWSVGQALWTFAVFEGWDPMLTPEASLGLPLPPNLFFIGFLVPMIGAVALHPHPRQPRRSAVGLADTALLLVALGFVFARFALLSSATTPAPRTLLFAALNLVLAGWGTVLWRGVEDHRWKTTYGLIALAMTLFGASSAIANGAGGPPPAPGGPFDLAWIVPFFLLASAALPAGAVAVASPLPGSLVVLLAGPGPLALDLALDWLVPWAGGTGHPSHVLLLLPTSVLLALGCALRLRLQEAQESRAQDEARVRAEEEQRAGRLATLASMSASIVEELQKCMALVVARASASAESLGEQGSRVVGQAQRANAIAQDLAVALRLLRSGVRKDVEVGALLEETVQAALDGGLGLQVSLEGIAGLPPASADPGALRAAFEHLVRNASQASPGGVLRVTGEATGSEVVLRFADDGPGVPDEIRQRIFDPFFTTRRVGDGVGLGLTFVHFVARDHGGSVVLEPGGAGACFTLRLPTGERRVEARPPVQWPFALAALTSAAAATAIAMLPAEVQGSASGVCQALAALAAAAALGWSARLRRGRERLFWALMASGPAIWGLVRTCHLAAGLSEKSFASGGGGFLVLYAVADLGWIGALILRPDRRRESLSSRLALLGGGATLLLLAYFYFYFVILPFPFVALDSALRDDVVLARGLLRAVIALWAGILALRAGSPHWRGVFGRLATVLAIWAVGHTLAGRAASQPGYRAGDLTDLGWIVPFLFLAAYAANEFLDARVERRAAPVALPAHPLWTAASLVGLAVIPAMQGLFGFRSGHDLLDIWRERMTDGTVFVVGLILACREILAHREASTTRVLLSGARTQLQSAERRSRLLGVVSSAVHELGGHVSAVRALARLLLAQPDLPERARGDATRIQTNTDAATRIVRNLLGMIRKAPEALTLVSANDLVREAAAQRAEDLALEGIRLELVLGQGIPAVPLDAAALQQVLLGLIDNAAVAIRSAGRGGVVQVATSAEGDQLVLGIADDGPGLGDAARRTLGGRMVLGVAGPGLPGLGLQLAREVVAEHGGTLDVRNRPEGGAVVEIRLPMAARAARQSTG